MCMMQHVVDALSLFLLAGWEEKLVHSIMKSKSVSREHAFPAHPYLGEIEVVKTHRGSSVHPYQDYPFREVLYLHQNLGD